MTWSVEYTDEFGEWWASLTEAEHISITAHVDKLEQRGPNLPFPYSSGLVGSRHAHMRELRVQTGGKPLRIFYAFDPRRIAILLIGGDKTGSKRFYDQMLRIADELYDVHLRRWRRRTTMVGRRSFSELRAGMSIEAQGKAEAEALRLGEEMDLADVRRAEVAQIKSPPRHPRPTPPRGGPPRP